MSVNVGESQITQSLNVTDLGVTFEKFLNFDEHISAICRNTYFGIIRNFLSYNACSTFIRALISYLLDYCITFLRTKRSTANTSESMRAHTKITSYRIHYPG